MQFQIVRRKRGGGKYLQLTPDNLSDIFSKYKQATIEITQIQMTAAFRVHERKRYIDFGFSRDQYKLAS
jgi:hypothetical protein